MRNKIYLIIEKDTTNSTLSKVYDVIMLIIITCSILPLAFKAQTPLLIGFDYVTTGIFIIDYLLRWLTADKKLDGRYTFIKYPFTPMAIVDLLAILPTFGIISGAFRLVKILRALKVMRIFKSLRYSKNFILISNVIKKNANILLSLLLCACFYILMSALFIFSIEPNSFANFFEALYWATTSLTTVGYGDIYPISNAGRLVSMVSSFFGIAMVALPSGVITAGFIKELEK